MKLPLKTLLVGALAAGGLSLAARTASAEIVCNEYNVCWHVHEHYDYQPTWNIAVHPDDWRWHQYRWHEHHGRGYWNSSGVWISF